MTTEPRTRAETGAKGAPRRGFTWLDALLIIAVLLLILQHTLLGG